MLYLKNFSALTCGYVNYKNAIKWKFKEEALCLVFADPVTFKGCSRQSTVA